MARSVIRVLQTLLVAVWKMGCRGQKRKQECQLGDHCKSPCEGWMMAWTKGKAARWTRVDRLGYMYFRDRTCKICS